MGEGISAVIVITVLLTVLVLPFAITSTVLGSISNTCDFVDPMGISASEWLLGSGIGGIIFYVLSLILLTWAISSEDAKPIVIFGVLVIVQALFSFSWFVVGGVVLFRSNISCIKEGAVMVSYGLAMWVMSAIGLYLSCQNSKNNKTDV